MQTHMNINAYRDLVAEDYIEAVDTRGNHLQGIVDLTSPDHGVVWIHTFAGERKLLDVHEHEIYSVNARSSHVRF